MSFDQYLASLSQGKKLSKVKSIILEMLWNAGTEFPRAWIASSSLLAATGQKYFDRRARELRDHIGCDLESQYVDSLGEHGWRLRANQLLIANPREYLTNLEKNKLFEKHAFLCVTCGKKVNAGVRGLQADHKIPLKRGGSHELTNWQPICNNCNVGKRRACEGCQDDCLQCPWAFPEKVGLKAIFALPPDLMSKLYELSEGSQQRMSQIVTDMLYKAIGNSN